MFAQLRRDARGWLKTPTPARLIAIAERAEAATALVPEERRADWGKLVLGFSRGETDAKRKARIEGLLRACELFEPKAPPPPLDFADPADALVGLGPQSRDALGKNGITRVADVVWILPIGWDDRRNPLGVAEAVARIATADLSAPPPRVCVAGVVKSAGVVPMRGRRAVRIVIADDDDPKITIHAWWFFAAHGVLAMAKPGGRCILSGRMKRDAPKPARMAHPDIALDDESGRVVRARYPRLGVGEAALRKAIGAAITRLPELPDPVPARIVAREELPAADTLLRAAHGDAGVLRAPPTDHAKRAMVERLAWSEAFTRVWDRLVVEARHGKTGAIALPKRADVLARLRAELGFALTPGQTSAIEAISAELARAVPMRRLVLGDVGTGKTAVALAAAAQCVSAGAQVAILAPTSVLAEQYMDAVAPLARATGAAIALVAAGLPAAQRRRAETQIASGKIQVAIGTHALLGEEITFARLGLVIVDEQHRLGVAQRLALVGKGASGKGTRPHLLTLSATPIPRTLALALRGELKTSILGERPKGRVPVATSMRPRADFESVVKELRVITAKGERAFFISPRIEVTADDLDDDVDPSSGAVARAEELAAALSPVAVALIHGGMRADEKRAVMRAFRAGDALVLVGTTVVEVGVDVPEATLMIIDHAERFGLAQLHQMRGRVGRGDVPGRCVLLHDQLDDLAARRLHALCTMSEGADIAKADLALRGAGDLGGTRQSGAEPELLYLDPASPPPWLSRIEPDAREIFARDPKLALPEHRALSLAIDRLTVAIAAREEAG